MRFLVAVMLLVPSGCGGGGGNQQLVVFAAASLTDAFVALAGGFEDEYPDVEVVVNTAASSELATQIVEGAPADVFASADLANMRTVVDARAVDGDPAVFATNRLEIMVERGNPFDIAGLDDLVEPDLVVVTCAPEVPCGAYATEVFARAGVDVVPDSYETNVRSVVTKVTLGEADAGIVYATDVLAAGEAADGVVIPAELNVVAEYPLAALVEATDRRRAHDFVEYVASADGRSILSRFGFTAP